MFKLLLLDWFWLVSRAVEASAVEANDCECCAAEEEEEMSFEVAVDSLTVVEDDDGREEEAVAAAVVVVLVKKSEEASFSNSSKAMMSDGGHYSSVHGAAWTARAADMSRDRINSMTRNWKEKRFNKSKVNRMTLIVQSFLK